MADIGEELQAIVCHLLYPLVERVFQLVGLEDEGHENQEQDYCRGEEHVERELVLVQLGVVCCLLVHILKIGILLLELHLLHPYYLGIFLCDHGRLQDIVPFELFPVEHSHGELYDALSFGGIDV